MSAEETTTNLGNCSHCTNIIFKDAVFNSEAMFSMRCPHCNKNLKVIIKRIIEITIIPVPPRNEATLKNKGPGLVAVILVLYLPPIAHRLAEGVDVFRDLFT
jgi:hypothetical protein